MILHNRTLVLVCASLVVYIDNAVAALPAKYVVIDLGTLGGRSSAALGINHSGQVTGWATIESGVQRAFKYDGTMHNLGALGGNRSVGFGINDNGQVVGEFSASITSFERYGFVFDTFTHELDALSGKQALFLDINNSGRITGRVENGAGFHAFIFDGTLHDLGALGFAESVGIELSETGYVTGSFGTLRLSASRPFLYDGTMHDLGSLGGSKGYGSDVNEYGEVAGSSAPVGAEPFHAFLYDGVMHDLGTLGGSSSEGFGINSSSIVVGASLLSNGESHGFVYSRDEGMIDLNLMIDNTSGWVLTDARAINDRGQVVGRGLIGGETHAYLLTPVPEPATACLIMGCLLGLGHYRSARAKRGLRSGSQAERLGELLSAAT